MGRQSRNKPLTGTKFRRNANRSPVATKSGTRAHTLPLEASIRGTSCRQDQNVRPVAPLDPTKVTDFPVHSPGPLIEHESECTRKIQRRPASEVHLGPAERVRTQACSDAGCCQHFSPSRTCKAPEPVLCPATFPPSRGASPQLCANITLPSSQ